MIILGVDPGLTRCGVGVIEAGEHRRLSFIHVDVVRSSPDITQDLRLLAIYNGLSEKMDRFAPDAVSIERVFAQSNRNTVLGTAQAAGLAMLAAAQRNIPVALHTPTADALALANCHALRPAGALQGGEREQHLTAAQRQWAEAAQKSTRRRINHDRGM